jgi:hypothetical protein
MGEASRKLRIVPKSKPRKDAVAMHGTVCVEASGEGHSLRTDSFW